MHPILFHLRLGSTDIPIYGYGTMLGLALLVGWYAAVRTARRIPLDSVTTGNVYAVVLVASLVGARLGYVLANARSFASVGEAFALSHGGLLGVGALALGLGAAAFVARRLEIAPLTLADNAMPALACIAAIVRVGCYLYGCDHGRLLSRGAPSWLAWLGRFPRVVDPANPDVVIGSPAYLQQMSDPNGALALDASTALPVHPTQLYEIVLALVVLALASVGLSRKWKPGTVALASMATYGFGRALIEPLRADVDRGYFLGASVTMLVGALGATAALAALIVRSLRARAAHA